MPNELRREHHTSRRAIPDETGECALFCLPVEYIPILVSLVSYLESAWAWDEERYADGYRIAQEIKAELAMATCGTEIANLQRVIIRLLGGIEDTAAPDGWDTDDGHLHRITRQLGYRMENASLLTGEARHLRDHIKELKEELVDIERLLGD